MKKNLYRVIGVMSGTSRDGIDLALIEFSKKTTKWAYHLLETATLAYPKKWRQQLAQADQLSTNEIDKLNDNYTIYLAEQIQHFINTHQLENIDAVCSHGHTILHQPKKGYTLQIGNQPRLAKLLNKLIVCDFRVQDVLLGGQGAPLVPIGDRLLFSEYTACVNLGGFANISFEQKQHRIAFDICPVNVVLNHYSEKLGLPFDQNGQIAREHTPNPNLVAQLDQLSFYRQAPPKSLGIEWVRHIVFPRIERSGLSPEIILASFTEHISRQIASALPNKSKSKILFTGGGAYNQYLIELIRQQTNAEIIIPNPSLIDYKEALIFGLLGILKLREEINVLSSVTGASKDHSSGKIYQTS